MLPRCPQNRETSAARKRAKRASERSDTRCPPVLPTCPELFKEPQHVPRGPPMLQDAPKRPKILTRCSPNLQANLNFNVFFLLLHALKLPNILRASRSFAKTGLSWGPLTPQTPQVGPKMPPRCPKMSQDGPKTPQDGPRWRQDGPSGPRVCLR